MTRSPVMDLRYTFNIFEAELWISFSAVLFVKAVRVSRERRRIFGGLSTAFLLFGVSDFIEAHTGAWWEPAWLLVWKAGCVAWLALGFFRYYKITKSHRIPGTQSCPPSL